MVKVGTLVRVRGIAAHYGRLGVVRAYQKSTINPTMSIVWVRMLDDVEELVFYGWSLEPAPTEEANDEVCEGSEGWN